MLPDVLYRLRALFRPSLQERELGEEFHFHMEMEERKLISEGLSPDTKPRDAEWHERYFHITDPSGHELSFAKPL